MLLVNENVQWARAKRALTQIVKLSLLVNESVQWARAQRALPKFFAIS